MCRHFPAESARSIEALQKQQVMATKLAEYIVRKLIAVSVVEEGDRELYVYGFFLLITRFFFFLVTVAFGVFLKIPCESVIFYIVFILLRSYAGGVHAKTEVACTIWTTLAIGATVFAIRVLEFSSVKILPLLIVGNLSVFLFSPLENIEKPVDADSRKEYRTICNVLLVVYDIVAVASLRLGVPVLCYSIVCGLSLEAFLLVVGKIAAKRRND